MGIVHGFARAYCNAQCTGCCITRCARTTTTDVDVHFPSPPAPRWRIQNFMTRGGRGVPRRPNTYRSKLQELAPAGALCVRSFRTLGADVGGVTHANGVELLCSLLDNTESTAAVASLDAAVARDEAARDDHGFLHPGALRRDCRRAPNMPGTELTVGVRVRARLLPVRAQRWSACACTAPSSTSSASECVCEHGSFQYELHVGV